MPFVRVELPQVAYERLITEAARQRRPIAWEAEIRLLRSLRVPLSTPAPSAPGGLTLVGAGHSTGGGNVDRG